jgi:hypothetical protein
VCLIHNSNTMLDQLNYLILGHILEFIPWIEWLNVRLSCHSCNDRLTVQMESGERWDMYYLSQLILKQLSIELKVEPEFISDLLYRTGNKICGSFPLQVMCGNVWKASDIDVLIATKSGSPYHSYDFIKPGGESEKHPELDLYTWDKRRFPSDYWFENAGHPNQTQRFYNLSYTYVGMERGRNQADWIDGNTKCEYKDLFDFIDKEADFQITKVLFDGKRVYIKNMKSLWQKHDVVYAKEFKRLPYYRYGDEGHDFVGRLKERCANYQAKGFTVHVPDMPTTKEGCNEMNEQIAKDRDIVLLHRFYKVFTQKSFTNYVLLGSMSYEVATETKSAPSSPRMF